MTFPDGSTYQALVTSTPIVRDGTVAAALSVWHDFAAYARDLVGDRCGKSKGDASLQRLLKSQTTSAKSMRPLPL
jgi:hypothetical protein